MTLRLALTLLLCAVRLGAAATQVVPSQPNNPSGLTWNCPDRQTIETAFYGYCPATYGDGSNAALTTIFSQMDYSPTQDGVQPTYQNEDGKYYLQCSYDENGNEDVNCLYTAPKDIYGGTNGGRSCREPSQDIPQPSPGMNYKRRGLSVRDVTRRPRFNCPFRSSDPLIWMQGALIKGGKDVPATVTSTGMSGTADDIIYMCDMNMDSSHNTGTGNTCYYLQKASGEVIFAGTSNGDQPNCPDTLCDNLNTGTHNMRRGFVERRSLARKQVDTKKLRKRLQREKHFGKRASK